MNSENVGDWDHNDIQGLIGYMGRGPRDSTSSSMYITMGQANTLDGHASFCGQLLTGYDWLKTINKQAMDDNTHGLLNDVTINDAGCFNYDSENDTTEWV